MKYLAVFEFDNGEMASQIFDSHEEMTHYIENVYCPHKYRVVLTMAFSTKNHSKYIDILSHNEV